MTGFQRQIAVWALALATIGFNTHVLVSGHRDKLLGGMGITSLFDSGPITASNGKDAQFQPEVHPWVEQIAESPQVYLYHNFLSEEERKHLIKLAAPIMRRSQILVNNAPKDSSARTSYGAFLRRMQDPIVERIQRRVELWTHYPVENQEDPQVLRYAPGQSYATHYDSAYDDNGKKEYLRMGTFLMYLSDVEAGGETAFPSQYAKWIDPEVPSSYKHEASPCAKDRVYAPAKAGDALLFYSYFPNGTMDLTSQHTGCPVIKGIKWSAPIWLHADPFRPDDLEHKPYSHEIQHDPGLCMDFDPECKAWAARGDCKSNEDWMVGGDFGAGQCRRSCNVCKPCDHADWDCRNANREKAGYLKLMPEEMEAVGLGDYFDTVHARRAPSQQPASDRKLSSKSGKSS